RRHRPRLARRTLPVDPRLSTAALPSSEGGAVLRCARRSRPRPLRRAGPLSLLTCVFLGPVVSSFVMSTTPLVTAIYARLSSASEESVSIARQVAECQAEADRRGWKVAVVATDDGVSATKNRPDERPGWRQVAARFDDLDAVLFWKSDRLTRRVSHFYEVIGQ